MLGICEKVDLILIDTDVIIWFMRGNQNAFEVLEKEKGFSISVVTYIELVQGMRNKNELNTLRKSLKSWNTEILYINEEISTKAMFYVEQFYLSHSMQLADALIGATAISHGIPLVTGNSKHYKFLKELNLSKFKP